MWSEEVLSVAVPDQVPWKRAAERVRLPFLSGNCVPWHMLSTSRVDWDFSTNSVVNAT